MERPQRGLKNVNLKCETSLNAFYHGHTYWNTTPDVVFIAIGPYKIEHITHFLERRVFNFTQTLANEDAEILFASTFPDHIIINSEGKICSISKGGHADIYYETDSILKNVRITTDKANL